jgi:hypothetical protein
MSSNRRSRSVPKKKAVQHTTEEEDVDESPDNQRRSSASPPHQKTSKSRRHAPSQSLLAPRASRNKALKEREEREEKRKKQAEHVAKWTGSLRNDLHNDDRPSFNLDTTIEGYENVDRNGKIRRPQDHRLEYGERQKRKQEQEELNQSWSNSLRDKFHQE